MGRPEWPTRPSVCLDCRTALTPASHCWKRSVATRSRLIPQRRFGRRTVPQSWPRVIGTVAAETSTDTPLTGQACVAFAQVFRYRRLRRVGTITPRDAATIGFDVQLDSGERVRVPPGLIAIDMRDAATVRIVGAEIEDNLGAIDPTRPKGEFGDETEHDTVPFTGIQQVVIPIGARVLGPWSDAPTSPPSPGTIASKRQPCWFPPERPAWHYRSASSACAMMPANAPGTDNGYRKLCCPHNMISTHLGDSRSWRIETSRRVRICRRNTLQKWISVIRQEEYDAEGLGKLAVAHGMICEIGS